MAKVSFCPPQDTYVFNFDFNKSTQTHKTSQNYGELLLAQYAIMPRKNMIKLYRIKVEQKVMKYVECFYAFNKYGNRIACLLMHSSVPRNKDEKVIVYSHTNAEGK